MSHWRPDSSALFTVTLSHALRKLRAGVDAGAPAGGGSWMTRKIWLVKKKPSGGSGLSGSRTDFDPSSVGTSARTSSMSPKNSDHRVCWVSFAWPVPSRPLMPVVNSIWVRINGGIRRVTGGVAGAAVEGRPPAVAGGAPVDRTLIRPEVGVTVRPEELARPPDGRLPPRVVPRGA